MKYLSENFRKNIYCCFKFEHDIEKMVGVREVFHIKKVIQKYKKKFLLLFYERNEFLNFIQNLSEPRSVRPFPEKIRFFDFLKFVYNFCKKIFFELILGVNLSCNGSHLPLQYGSNPSEGTQTMLILRRPL